MILKIRQALGGVFDILGDIAVNETGFVRQRSGFAAAWVVGVLVVGAVLFGAPDRAVADQCVNYQASMPDCIPYACNQWCEHAPPWEDCHGTCVTTELCQCWGPFK